MNVYILGAGPAGLSLSYYLSKLGIKSTVFELTNHIGGMARTWTWNHFLLETGPHLLHTPLKDIWDDWKLLLGPDLIEQQFFSANYLSNGSQEYLFDYPLNLPQVLTSSYWSTEQLESIKSELCDKPDLQMLSSATSFSEYVDGLVGSTLSNIFFKRYPEKVWDISTTEMLPDWAPKRLRTCDSQESFFQDQYSGISRYGSGDLFSKIQKSITLQGSIINLNEPITSINIHHNHVQSFETTKRTVDVNSEDLIISTIPISNFSRLLGFDFSIKFRGIASVYLAFEDIPTLLPDPYSWLYFSDNSVFNRITEPTKLSKSLNLLTSDRTYLVCEKAITLDSSRPYDSLSSQIIESTKRDFNNIPMFSKYNIDKSAINIEPYVYPIQTHANKLLYREIASRIIKINNIELIGTGSNYAYNDMQVIFKQAKEMAQDIYSSKRGTSLLMSTFSKMCSSSLDTTKNIDSIDEPSLSLIAEIGINHNGDVKRLLQLATKACETSDIVKVQYFQLPDRIGAQVREVNYVEKAQDVEESIADTLKRCELTLDDIQLVREQVYNNNRKFMCTVFGIQDSKDILSLGVDHIKIASMDLNNYPLHRYIASYSKPLHVYISTGMSTIQEINAALSIYNDSLHELHLLACTSSYPAPDSSLNLRSISYLLDLNPTLGIGYSDHSVGVNACLAAISLGATILEVHFTDDKRVSGPDQMLSKTSRDIEHIKEFYSFYSSAKGLPNKALQPAEYFTWKTQRKSLYALGNISKGEEINYHNVALRSPPLGISPVLLENNCLIASSDIIDAHPITFSNISFSND
ncbi:N,N'-diacetyllegionaminic acid synthase [Prochlorococcus marinus str. MIT 1313]|uniref:N-acetylneuraminate synthase family protein n=1 Tax=Prochlorococcus TaxID=1218 RepID=UPI0007B3A29E|nr:N-acetylneuraminate synthase family protein [Prochlorococcus marinus]KZR70257.1 N,N'-diacetyllegionaminic acid synthase [Prochlorococcus marinus str. MIT 1313]KZR70729.1 N,N'-diacetyllegionaminic acid synthase [Prochlorococcus marinus str. MIT 1318]